mmetsp:Transcript_5562/g.8516  ORF Transcript_5562/g.8516 Transcript_5562/m.8516 type:complete len:666 (+) Transcript_5562:80-2077(+)
MSDPALAVAQAMSAVRGKRTGIMISRKGTIPVEKVSGMEDVDTFWDNAKSPDPVINNVSAKKKKKKNQSGNRALKDRNQANSAREKMKPSMTLPNTAKIEGDDSSSIASSRKPVNKFLSRAISSKGGKVDWSPSDLSRVSTAPPTPASIESDKNIEITQDEIEEEQPVDDIVPEDNVPYSPPDMARASSTDVDEESIAPQKQSIESVEKEEVALPITSEEEKIEQIMMEEDLPPPFDDDDGEEDDLLPPPPPEDDNSSDEDDQNEVSAPLEREKPSTDFPDNVDIPNTMEEDQDIHHDNDDVGDDEDDDLDDDKEGTGFSMVHDPETPESVRAERLQQEKDEIERKHKRKKEERDSITPKPKTRKRKPKKVTYSSPLGYPAGNRDYEVVPVSDFKESPEPGVRRSRRAKMPPLQWWKNERSVYGYHNEEGVLGEAMGDMPVVVDVMKAMPTPYKKRKPIKSADSTSKSVNKKSKTAKRSSGKVDPETPFDDRKLRKKLEIVNGEVAHLWDEPLDEATDMKVVAYAKDMISTKLPSPKGRRKGESKVIGEASQAFNIPTDENSIYMGYIMGKLELPPRGIKDSEAVGGCAQTFTVCACQPGSLEVAYADPHSPDGELDPDTAQRFLLHPGDMFRIPPGNCYRIENHSKTTDCLLTWTIIRPRLVHP